MTKANEWGLSREGERGCLVLTTLRLGFFKEVKGQESTFERRQTLYLHEIISLIAGGILDEFVAVNGTKYFIHDAYKVRDTIRQAMQNAKAGLSPNAGPSSSPMFNTGPLSPLLSAGGSNSLNTIFCPMCGVPNEGNAKFCNQCGARIQ